jgi:hypothetical protein
MNYAILEKVVHWVKLSRIVPSTYTAFPAPRHSTHSSPNPFSEFRVAVHLEWVYSSLQRAGGISQWKREIPSQENLCVYIHSQTFPGKSSGLLKMADSAGLPAPVF